MSDHRKEKREPRHDSQPPAGGERVGGKDCCSASALPVHRSGRKERLSVYTDRSRGQEATHEATSNAICLADFGDSGVAFVAVPQNPPRNVNWASSGRWVHVAKVAFEKYFLHKVRAGTTDPYYEKVVMKLLDIGKIKTPAA